MPYASQKQQNEYVREVWYKKPENRAKQLLSVSRFKENKYVKIRDLKRGKPCTDCKRIYEDPEMMDWDHVPGRGKKLFNLSQLRDRSWETIFKEIEKCDLVCANCHRLRTRNRRVFNLV